MKPVPDALNSWSAAALAVAEHLVRKSETGAKFDPQTSIKQVSQELGMPEDDARIGVLDLKDIGSVEESREMSSDAFWPADGLFVEFDSHFLDPSRP